MILTQHQTTRFLQPQLLLKLQRTQTCYRLKMLMETRNTHPEFLCELLNTKGLIKILMDALNGLSNCRDRAAHNGQMTKPATLLTPQKPIDDFSHNPWHENGSFSGCTQKPHKPHE